MDAIKIAAAQINPKVGDLEGNLCKIMNAYIEAGCAGADLLVAPECVLTGYPLEDLVFRESFMVAVEVELNKLATLILGGERPFKTALIFGSPILVNGAVENRAYLFDPATPDHVQFTTKVELPNYGVFDEKRTFKSGSKAKCLEWRGHKLGVMICEDAWFPTVTRDLANDGAELLISINGSPFEAGKNVTRRKVVADRIKESALPFLYVNLVGGQDELVFDGGSFFYDGEKVQEAPHFEDGMFFFEAALQSPEELDALAKEAYMKGATTGQASVMAPWADVKSHVRDHFRSISRRTTLLSDTYTKVEPTGLKEIYQALVLALRDYMRKQGFKSVVIGYSGGVDSGLVAAIACDAIGSENVHLIRLPSAFSSQHSLDDAAAGAERLGAPMRTIKIEPIVNALRHAYQMSFVSDDNGQHTPPEWNPGDAWPKLEGVADENIQARARGNILMAISNQEHRLLLTTGNKSEVSVGYATLYGDMSGGYNPIKDCYKTTVWDLCRWRNAQTAETLAALGFLGRVAEVVPEEIIVKPPSAELRPDQKDEDSLPPYPELDAMLKGMIEDELSVKDIVNQMGFAYDAVMKVRNLVDRNEYKRRQAAPGVKITSKIHGRDRRYPIVNGWRG